MFFKKKNEEEKKVNDQALNEAASEQEEETKNPDGLIGAEEYDINPQIAKNQEMEALVADKEGIEIDYSFNGEDIKEGLKVFQKNTIYKRNIIYTMILALIFAVYAVNLVMHPGETVSIFLSIMCITVICFIWYLPIKHIKTTAKAVDENDEMNFKITIYDNCVKIAEENGSFFISYKKEITKVLETENLFLICVGKERMFMLPKRYVCEKEEKIREIFMQGMEDGYKDCIVKPKQK